ncbi:hypothetical protein KGF56_000952 [Candida oxycetoniae]|uniref:DUF155 domain-containing protein n=1 Tax=Candida oxycetoniae TaxID=497107 RepID=A0AAI9SZL1_9ASCO|nr:uncharacterized protein KGF56_000952 [Candida oxycetoniae]KAI3406111.1 hypothetical protein KGF56_000952 [Candida oxycetoniae]
MFQIFQCTLIRRCLNRNLLLKSIRLNTTSSATKIRKNIPKKKIGAQNLRRTDSKLQHESTSYIVSLLNENRAENSPSKILEKHLSIVTSVTVGGAINLEKALCAIDSYDHQVIIPEEVLSVKTTGSNLMILSNGTLVGWNMTEEDIVSNFLPQLKNSIESQFDVFESEEIDWIELKEVSDRPLNNGNSYLHGEILVVQGLTEKERLLDMAAFAIGLSRSTRLSILETQLDGFLELTKQNSDRLANGKRLITTEHEFLKITGKLYQLRGKLNLYSELIDTPDLYWTEPFLEKIYNSVSKILDINSRIAIMNRKLDYATEEQRAFLSVLNEKKSTRLEWIIILLIMIEVGFEMFHFYEKYEENKQQSVQSVDE